MQSKHKSGKILYGKAISFFNIFEKRLSKMMNRAERLCEQAETFASRGLTFMGRYLFEKDIVQLKKQGFMIEKINQHTDGSWYCFIIWKLKRPLSFAESQFISWGNDEEIPPTKTRAERCVLIYLREQAKKYETRPTEGNDN